MLVYVDTSVLVAAHTHEAQTPIAQAWLAADSRELVVSLWALVECESALAIKLRRGELTAEAQSEAMDDIDALIIHLPPVVVPVEADYRRGRALCRDAASRIRAGDALHLSIALRLEATHFATLDQVLSANAAAHGFAVPPTGLQTT